MSNEENIIINHKFNDSHSDNEYLNSNKDKEENKEENKEKTIQEKKQTYSKRIYETNPDYMYYQKAFYYKRKYENDVWVQSIFNNPKLTNKDIYEKMKVYNEYRSFTHKLKQKSVKIKKHKEPYESLPNVPPDE